MRITLLPALLVLSIAPALLSGQTRYLNEVFSSVEKSEAIPFGRTIDWRGDSIDLLLDLYAPANDPSGQRPLIILAHGGGFTSGVRSESKIDSLSHRFARRGWTVATVDYRLQPILLNEEHGTLAIVQGVQDVKAAVRFFRRYPDRFNLDTNLIVLGGISAGAIISLHIGFVDLPDLEGLFDPTLLEGLGGFEGESGNPGFSSRVDGVINLWGGLIDSAFIGPGEIPVVSVHGTHDPTVPYEHLALSPHDTVGSTLHGSAPITRTARRNSIPTDLLPFEGYAHGVGNAESEEMEQTTEFIAAFLWRTFFGESGVAVDGRSDGLLDLR